MKDHQASPMVTAATEGPTNPAVYPEQPRCPLSAASLETLQETDGESKEEGGDRWGGEEKRRKADRRQEGAGDREDERDFPGQSHFWTPPPTQGSLSSPSPTSPARADFSTSPSLPASQDSASRGFFPGLNSVLRREIFHPVQMT